MVALIRLKTKDLAKEATYKSTKTLIVAELVAFYNFLGVLTAAWGPGHGAMSDKFIGEIFPPRKSYNYRISGLNGSYKSYNHPSNHQSEMKYLLQYVKHQERYKRV